MAGTSDKVFLRAFKWFQTSVTFLQGEIPLAALGIGVGALAAGTLSGRNIEFGIVPVGAVLLALACLLLGLVTPGIAAVCVLMILLGIGSGLFIVNADGSGRRQLTLSRSVDSVEWLDNGRLRFTTFIGGL